jgi:hypothetical protein
METKQLILRQGDVLLIEVASIPEHCKPVKNEGERCILAYGEVTGHAHVIPARSVQQFCDKPVFSADAERYIQMLNDDALTHEEHTAHPLPSGKMFRVAIQNEYFPLELRRVAD